MKGYNKTMSYTSDYYPTETLIFVDLFYYPIIIIIIIIMMMNHVCGSLP